VTSEKVFFYAVSSYKIKRIEILKGEKGALPVVDFIDGSKPVEIKIGLSFVSTETPEKTSTRSLAIRASRG
jgi:hypothetical protein